VVHLVLRRHAPHASVVDLTHAIAVHDVRAGALALWRAAPWLDSAVVLGLVDPLGGGGSRPVAVEVHRSGDSDGAVFLVGPDNGLLTPALHRMGGAGRVVRIPGGGGTFVGRDVLAPAAARLAAGAGLVSLGTQFDPAELVGGPLVPVEVAGEVAAEVGVEVTAEVWGVDRFGNVQLGLVPAGLGPGPFTVEVPGRAGSHPAVLASSYGDLPPGVFGVIPDADGLVSLSLARGPAAPVLGAGPGVQFRLRGPAA
jgi:S-adenosylmethionine hydrolase